MVLVKKNAQTTISLHQGSSDRKDAKDSIDERDAKQSSNESSTTYQRQGSLSSSVDPPEFLDVMDAKGGGDIQNDDVWKKQLPEDGNAGFEMSGVGSVSSDKTDAVWTPFKEVPVSPAPIYKDCLVMYATPPGKHF